MSAVDWDETKRRAYEQRRVAGLSVPTPEENQAAMLRLCAEVRAWQLAEVRRNQGRSPLGIAAAMGVAVSQVSAIENGEADRTEVAILRAYVEALGGRIRVIADLGDTSYRVV